MDQLTTVCLLADHTSFARVWDFNQFIERKNAMIPKLLSFVAAAAILVQPAYTQSQGADSPKQAKAGESLQLADGVTVKVTKASKSPFTAAKVKGEALVIVLEFDAGKKNASLAYRLGTDAKRSDIFLTSGEQRLGPQAVVEDFSSWGSENDKEVETLEPSDGPVGSTLRFVGKGSVSLLFDVPADQAKTQKKVAITIKSVAPTAEEHSFIVSL